MTEGLRPLFVLSPPRAGSTLVQRVLATHPDIATANEPWLLLPQVYAMRERGMYAEFGQVPSSRAIREFAESLPNGMADYQQALRGFILDLYARAARGRGRYFLDKTPRYAFIAEDLFDLFPDGAFVFLWRNPLAVLASIVETWGGGRWTFHRWRVDLFEGVASLTAAYERHGNRALAVRYEDLVGDPAVAWPRLFEHLGLSFDHSSLTTFTDRRFTGRMGDRSGQDQYGELSAEPVDKWKRTLSNPYRKAWARRYLHWLGSGRLSEMGYDLVSLQGELDSAPSGPRRLASDLIRAGYSRLASSSRRRAARRVAQPGRW